MLILVSIKDETVYLIKYIANSGLLSRRHAGLAIKNGDVRVNSTKITDPAYTLKEGDIVYLKNKRVTVNKEKVYLMLHKPAGYLTSSTDALGRATIYDLLPKNVLAHGLDYVGRLDLMTSGLLLLTNDGELVYALSHPKFSVKKVYKVTASRPLNSDIVAVIKKGVKLPEGVVAPDEVVWSEKRPHSITITLHSGKYRVIRRIFEALSIFVKKLTRISFDVLSLAKLPVGRWRHLEQEEKEYLFSLQKKRKK
jgi:23S rRNA pseudouridine2605 synthase